MHEAFGSIEDQNQLYNANAAGGGEATVCKLQVGLLGSARGLQKDLERIAGRADTNTPDGLHYVLQGMPLLLLQVCFAFC